MIVIGMTGPIGHGKSTFAQALEELEPSTFRLEFSTIVIEVANAMHGVLQEVPTRDNLEAVNGWLRSLPVILLQVVHTKVGFDKIILTTEGVNQHPVDYEKLFLHIDNLTHNPKLSKQNISRDNKEAYRPFLQWLGGYMVEKVDPAIWQKEVVRRVQDARRQGFKLCIIGGLRFPADADVVRAQQNAKIIKVYRPGHLQYDILDPTERERDNIKVDCTIMSNGGIADVKQCAARVYKDIQAGTLEGLYQTKQT